MHVLIAVRDPLPLYRRGIMAALGEAGFTAEAPDDLLTWLHEDQRRVLLLTMDSPSDWALLAKLRRTQTDLIVVAVLTDASVQSYVRALLTGASAAVPREASPEAVKQVFEQVLEGFSVLPVAVVQALAVRHHQTVDQPAPPEHELAWLRELARGATVAQLAERSGYSERAMFRLLRDLYKRLEARNRTEALMLAHQHGWL